MITGRVCSVINRYGVEVAVYRIFHNSGRHYFLPEVEHLASLRSLRPLLLRDVVNPGRGILLLPKRLQAAAQLLPLELFQ